MAAPSQLALSRAAELFDRDVDDLPRERGYIDLAGDDAQPGWEGGLGVGADLCLAKTATRPPKTAGGTIPVSLAQRLMRSRVVPNIYERWWRPALGRVVKGPTGPSMAQEERLASELLSLGQDATVLDVGCGPGNFTRRFAREVGERGTVIGIDLSAPMLERAAADTRAPQVVYVRADAVDLTMRRSSVDAVCCFAALHLFSDPWAAVDVMARVLVPGGRLAILTTVRPRSHLGATVTELFGHLSGVRMFDGVELADALADRGLEVFYQRTFGLMQIVGARA